MTDSGIEARRAAHHLLGEVLERRHPLDEAWEAALARGRELGALEPRDRAFARLLVATVLRRLGQIDAMLLHCLDRPLTSQMTDTFHALRLGVAQLVFLGTPGHAAVSTSVELVHYDPRRKGLVNAILRRLAREQDAILSSQDEARLNTPDWLWQSWCETYGEQGVRAIAEAHLREAPLDISVKGDPMPWVTRLEADLLPTGSLRRAGGGPIDLLPGYAEGAWWVQDAAAALPVRLLGPVAGLTVIDLCAAPGGKTAQLAALGARVIAVDRSAPRLERLKANLSRLDLDAQTVTADAATFACDSPVDAVLLDAPCSATGTIRRHPDILHLKRPEDVTKLAALQDRLLGQAWKNLKPGGLLVYCTCSLQREEGEARIESQLAAGAPLERVPIQPGENAVPAEAITADGAMRTLPSFWAERGGMDGFYACRLRRT